METTIKITGLESKQASTGNTKIILKSDNLKYFFWQNKADGSQSIAQQEFTSLGLQVGDVVQAYVNEEEKEWTNPQGKLIKYTDRFISKFLTKVDAQNAPVNAPAPQTAPIYQNNVPTQPATPQTVPTDTLAQLNDNMQKLVGKIQDIDKRLQGVETYIHHERENGKEGLELHQSMDMRQDKDKLTDEDVPDVEAQDMGSTQDVEIPIIEDVKVEDLPI